jgi:hypothetical protein
MEDRVATAEHHDFDIFVENVLNRMADYNWSAYPELQDSTTGDLKAAALLLWRLKERTPNEELMIRVLRSRIGFSSDEGALCASDDTVRSFMDRADDFKLPSFVIDQLHSHLATTVMAWEKQKGNHVVFLTDRLPTTVTAAEEGYYLFCGKDLDL